MRTWIITLSFLGLASGSYGAEPAWVPDYTLARKEAAASKKPVFVQFTSDSCIYCRRLESTTLRDPGLLKYLDRCICVKVNGPQEPGLVQQAMVTSYPSILIVLPDGRIVVSLSGYQPATELIDAFAWMEENELIAKAPIQPVSVTRSAAKVSPPPAK
ncbi:MAG: thioredoxin family protein [Gemmataceae bacterium]